MSNRTPPVTHSLEEALIVIGKLRDRVDRHEQLLEIIMARLQSLPEQPTPGWIPFAVQEGEVKSFQPSQKIRKLEVLPKESRDNFGRLRGSLLGQLYTSKLKNYRIIRLIVHWTWRNGYPVYVNHLASLFSGRNAIRFRPLIKLSAFVKKSGISTYKLLDTALVETPQPRVFPICDQSYLTSPHDRFRFPDIYVATMIDAIISGGTNLILSGDCVVCHDMYDFGRDSTSEELHGRTLIDPEARRIRWLLHDDEPESIPLAATFVDACASNYAHWMTEVLPRIVLFCAEQRFADVPIVVNDGLHKNIMESLFLVVGAHREIIALPIGRAMSVSKLYVTSATGYVPFGRRKSNLSGHSHGLFSPQSFELLRDHLSRLGRGAALEAWPEKIYLRRNSSARGVINASEIEKLLCSREYLVVEPEKLTFLQQIQLFSHAKEIISPTGGALANAIACKPGTQVTILMAKHKDMIFRYWSNLLTPFGIRVNYVLGNIVQNHDLGIHGDFLIDTDCINELLEESSEK